MEWAFIIWAIGTLPAIGKGFAIIGIISSALILVINGICAAEDIEIKLHSWLFLTIPLALIGAVIPDKETAMAMAAGYGVQSVVENERVQKIAGQGVDILETFLEKTKKEREKEATPQK